MPSVEHKTVVNAPLPIVWNFIKEMSNWAPFLEGYQKHEEINDTESIWTLKGDVGILCRIVEMKITITEWIDHEKVAFKINGITEKATGDGVFLASPGDAPDTSKLYFQFTINAGGLIGPVANVLMKPMLRPVAEKMAVNIKGVIEKQNHA
jgi:carbon monoxide dehydrogenase subunit G